jgi:hypothetical protein
LNLFSIDWQKVYRSPVIARAIYHTFIILPQTKINFMKVNLLILCVGIALFSSCKKKDTTTTAPQPKMQFAINGTTYNRDATNTGGVWVNGPQIEKNGSGRYELEGGNMPEPVIVGLDLCACSTVAAGTYPVSGQAGSEIQHNSKVYSGLNYTVVITSINNGLATGTFSGTFSAYLAPSDVINVTNGTFSNVPIIP